MCSLWKGVLEPNDDDREAYICISRLSMNAYDKNKFSCIGLVVYSMPAMHQRPAFLEKTSLRFRPFVLCKTTREHRCLVRSISFSTTAYLYTSYCALGVFSLAGFTSTPHPPTLHPTVLPTHSMVATNVDCIFDPFRSTGLHGRFGDSQRHN